MVAVGDGVLYIVETTYHGDGHSNGAIIHVHSLTGEHLRVIRGDWCISSLYIDERRLYLYSRARVRHRHLNLGWALPCDWCIIVLSPEGVLLQTFKMHTKLIRTQWSPSATRCSWIFNLTSTSCRAPDSA